MENRYINIMIISVLFIALINVISYYSGVLQASRLVHDSSQQLQLVLISLLTILLGVLLEYRRVFRIIQKKVLKVNWLIIPSVILLLYALFPYSLLYSFWFETDTYLGWLINPLTDINASRFIIHFMTGILLARSFNAA